mmetsp:Transcript_47569/g.103548  ORF Transcript_47569/g.103548 Transcript_47569/m.103548 type:complete len:175 (-) Transcript_47569:349-873(-)
MDFIMTQVAAEHAYEKSVGIIFQAQEHIGNEETDVVVKTFMTDLINVAKERAAVLSAFVDISVLHDIALSDSARPKHWEDNALRAEEDSDEESASAQQSFLADVPQSAGDTPCGAADQAYKDQFALQQVLGAASGTQAVDWNSLQYAFTGYESLQHSSGPHGWYGYGYAGHKHA